MALLLANCATPGNRASPNATHYYCAATAASGSGPTLVITERTYPFSGPVSAFAAAAPQLQDSFAAYVGKTWAGLSISPLCHAEASENAAETARGAEVGRYEGQGYAIMRASYWQPG